MRKVLILFLTLIATQEAVGQLKLQEATPETGVSFMTVQDELGGGGVTAFDYDNDGLYDLYLPGGDTYDALYKNNGDGTFRYTARTAGIREHGNNNTHAGTAFDYDNDGFVDLYITTHRSSDILYHNNGNGTFTNVTIPAGIFQPTGVNDNMCGTFGDFDGDGDDDLFVARWIDTSRWEFAPDFSKVTYLHSGLPNQLYINNGDGTFTESARKFGVEGNGTSIIAMFVDYDLDGDLDLLIGNDFGVDLEKNQVYKNQLVETGEAKFVEVSESIGMQSGLFCMGIGMSDYDRDGDFDFYETNIGPELLLQNNGGTFVDVAKQAKVGVGMLPDSSAFTTSWGPVWADYDNDGWEDVFVVHGQMPVFRPRTTTLSDTSRLYYNLGNGSFRDETLQCGFITDAVGRSAIDFDYDADGRMDIVFNPIEKPPPSKNTGVQVLHNITQRTGHFLNLKLVGRMCGPEAIGATIKVWAEGKASMKQVVTGGNYLSQSPLVQHFGLGSATAVDSVVVYWPAQHKDQSLQSRTSVYHNLKIDALNTLTEGELAEVYAEEVRFNVASLVYLPVEDAVRLRNLQPSARVEIFDVLGRSQLSARSSARSNDGQILLRTQNLATGRYFVRISGENGPQLLSFVKVAQR